jgi:predicted nucleic acid-binding protein
VILYLDTSSLLKHYIREPGSDDVALWIDGADLVATSRATLAEAAAALSRRPRGGGLSRSACHEALADLTRDWADYLAVDLDEHRAATLAWRRRLRGYDAVQLDAALTVGELAAPEALVFSSFDADLNEAARAEGLAVLEPLV